MRSAGTKPSRDGTGAVYILSISPELEQEAVLVQERASGGNAGDAVLCVLHCSHCMLCCKLHAQPTGESNQLLPFHPGVVCVSLTAALCPSQVWNAFIELGAPALPECSFLACGSTSGRGIDIFNALQFN